MVLLDHWPSGPSSWPSKESRISGLWSSGLDILFTSYSRNGFLDVYSRRFLASQGAYRLGLAANEMGPLHGPSSQISLKRSLALIEPIHID